MYAAKHKTFAALVATTSTALGCDERQWGTPKGTPATTVRGVTT